jgi:predicted RNA binding protein YcfA (HicA-like mRNA interferase family)
MSQHEKIKARIMAGRVPKDIMPTELQAFMTKADFELRDIRGDHYIYKHPELTYHLSIPMHKPVKPVYIKMIAEALEKIKGGENE